MGYHGCLLYNTKNEMMRSFGDNPHVCAKCDKSKYIDGILSCSIIDDETNKVISEVHSNDN